MQVDSPTKRVKTHDIDSSASLCHPNVPRTTNVTLLRDADQAIQESNRIHVRPIVDEVKLGIEFFVGDLSNGFHGLIKTRYADFIVHEVDPNGNIVALTDLEAPEEHNPTPTINLSDIIDKNAIECLGEVNDGYLNQYRIDVTGMDKDTRTSLHYSIRAAFDRVESTTLTEEEIRKQDKNEKTATTGEKPDNQQVNQNDEQLKNGVEKRYIVVNRRNKISRPKNIWPRDRPDYTHFILYKENKDTMDAVHSLASSLNMRPSNFAYAGTKDKRAVTTQWISSWRLEPKRLIGAARRFNKRPFLKVGNFCFKKDPLRLGELRSNKFDIVVRHLVYDGVGREIIERSISGVREHGFVNYFGLQRFGTRSIQTHEIGLAVLQEKWAEAVDLILSYRFDNNMQPLSKARNGDTADAESPGAQSSSSGFLDEQAAAARQESPVILGRPGKSDVKTWPNGAEQHNNFIDLWKSKLDAETVFKKYPHFRYTNEGMLMKSLSKSEESSQDYLSAFLSLPRNTRSMYVHSYQSLIWNKITTYRLKTYGFKVVAGDLILPPESNISDNSLDLLLASDDIDTESTSNNNNNKKQDGSATGPAAPDKTPVNKNPLEELESKLVVATENDAHKYSIFDVVLPIVGSRVRLPSNDVGELTKKLLQDDNLTLESFRTREKCFISFGSYRKIMVKPLNVDWVVKQYANPQHNLIDTDLERLSRQTSTKSKGDKDHSHEEPTNSQSNGADADGESGVCERSSAIAAAAAAASTSVNGNGATPKPRSPPRSDSLDEALVVSFELPPSCYATMCLREIMKKPSTTFNSKF